MIRGSVAPDGITVHAACPRCTEGSGEEAQALRFAVALAVPQSSGYLEPRDWLPAAGVHCPVCDAEVGEEALHEALLEALQDAVMAWSRETGWPNYHGDWRPGNWSGHCGHLAAACAPAFGGRGASGFYSGPVSDLSEPAFAARAGHVGHSWIQLEDGRILDPTRWAFFDDLLELEEEDALQRAVSPRVRLYLTAADDSEYGR